MAKIEEVAKKHNLTLAEIALRWISHHSLMKREYGDAVLIGASSVKHIEEVRVISWLNFSTINKLLITLIHQNLIDLEKGPLRKFKQRKL